MSGRTCDPGEAARLVFGGHGKGGMRSSSWHDRKPTPAQRIEAQRFARLLETLSLPSVTLTHVPSTLPPGRLRGREMVRQGAERDMGLLSTATPWEASKRQRSHTRPVIVGVMTDVSGSMGWAEDFVADFAWQMATAGCRVGARTAAVTFGDSAEMVTRPGEIPQDVKVRSANGGSEAFDAAAGAIEGVLHLSVPITAAKVLFIVSDGHLVNHGEPEKATKWIEKWTQGGTLVVWIGLDRTELLSQQRKPGKAIAISGSRGHDVPKIMKAMEAEVVKAARGMT